MWVRRVVVQNMLVAAHLWPQRAMHNGDVLVARSEGREMTTLTQMERTATGWKCPRCGSTREDDLLPVRVVECNCVGLDAFRYGQIVTLTAEQLRKRYPSSPRVRRKP